MKVVIINKSDSTGGAAVVSRRLMEALRVKGIDARMIVCEKLSDSPYVELASTPKKIRRRFLRERLRIFLANGLNRSSLFKIDTGDCGLPLWKHPLVKSSDAILINWVNQGMLSLKGVKKIMALKKPVVWTMHDMWCMTGICHHAGQCDHFHEECGDCPLLKRIASPRDLSYKIWKRKDKIYHKPGLLARTAFVAVSTWLKDKASVSSLLGKQRVVVIPNAFKAQDTSAYPLRIDNKIRLLFGAARLDDPIKGLSILKRATQLIKNEYPSIAAGLEVTVFGSVKEKSSLEGFDLPLTNLGVLQGDEEVAKAYLNSDIVVSASSYETLPGTLVEAQAYGCVPVCFKRGGQPDIIDQLSTGFMAEYSDDPEIRTRNLVQGIIWAYSIVTDSVRKRIITARMKDSVEQKFSYDQIAGRYISLIKLLSEAK